MERTGQPIASFEDGGRGPAAKECRPSPESDKDKGTDSSLEPPQGHSSVTTLVLAQGDPLLSPRTLRVVLHQAPEFVAACYSSKRGRTHRPPPPCASWPLGNVSGIVSGSVECPIVSPEAMRGKGFWVL